MIRPVTTLAILATLALLLAARPASAQISRLHYISRSHLNLVGRDPAAVGDQADAAAPFSTITVTVRELDDITPVPNLPVVLDFSGCASDTRLSAVQSYHGETVVCAPPTVQGYTGADGTCTLAVIGGRSGNVAHPVHCCQVYADGFLVANIGVGLFDQNNIGGVNGVDLGLVGYDLFLAQNPERSDFNGDGLVNGLDLSLLGIALFGHSPSSGASICP